jgi:hypothetical protein
MATHGRPHTEGLVDSELIGLPLDWSCSTLWPSAVVTTQQKTAGILPGQ